MTLTGTCERSPFGQSIVDVRGFDSELVPTSLFMKIKGWFQRPVSKAGVRTLLRIASEDDWERSRHAKAELRKRTDSSSLQALIAAVASKDETRYEAARVLGELKCSQAIPALLGAINVPSRYVGVHFAADAVINIGNPAAAAGALELLSQSGIVQQRAGACILGYLGSPENVPKLILSLESAADPLVRKEIVEALGRLGASRADETLLRIARGNGDESSRIEAIYALGKIRSADARGHLQMLTQDSSPGIRTAAVVQLGDCYLDADSAGTLARIANDDPDPATRNLAISYLKVFEKTRSKADDRNEALDRQRQ